MMAMAPTFLESERAFVQQAARQRVTTYDGHTWEYYDCGKPKPNSARSEAADAAPPLVCLPGVSGSAKCFHLQAMGLSQKGYRVVAVQHPIVWTQEEWIHSFDRFLDAMGFQQVHIYGVSLGAYLAQRYSAMYPHRVASLAMTQGYCDTSPFASKAPWISTLAYMPDFYLKKHMLEQLPKQPSRNPAHVCATDYMAEQVTKLTQQEAACYMTLQCQSCSAKSWRLALPDEKITLIDSYGDTTLPATLREEWLQRHPCAKKAMIKDAGDFPFLSHFEEVNMHLQVHLRSNGCFIE